jgi:hypothetical protein
VIYVNGVAGSLSTVNATTTPQYVGRAVLATIKGMTQASLSGARLDLDSFRLGGFPADVESAPATAEMLSILLADGARSTLASINTIAGILPFPRCPAQLQTINIHWRFGNQRQLGWIAIIITFGAGVVGFLMLKRLCYMKRITGLGGLNLATIFLLGVDSDVSEVPNEQLRDTMMKLQLERGRVVVSLYQLYIFRGLTPRFYCSHALIRPRNRTPR